MLTTYDVRWACDVMRPAYDASDGVDGRVSIEVDPRLAHETDKTVAEARRCGGWSTGRTCSSRSRRPRPGLPAITATLAEGISVNVTLIFWLDRYEAVMDAFLAGLEQAKANGHDLSKIGSVASFFVSRVDTEIDKRLDKIGTAGGEGAARARPRIANARLAYERYEEVFGSRPLAGAGRRRRPPAAPAVGVDLDQEPGVPRRHLRRGAGRARAWSTPCRRRSSTRSPTTARPRRHRSPARTTTAQQGARRPRRRRRRPRRRGRHAGARGRGEVRGELAGAARRRHASRSAAAAGADKPSDAGQGQRRPRQRRRAATRERRPADRAVGGGRRPGRLRRGRGRPSAAASTRHALVAGRRARPAGRARTPRCGVRTPRPRRRSGSAGWTPSGAAGNCSPSSPSCAPKLADLDHVVLAGMGGSSLAPEVIARPSASPLTVLDTTDPGQVRRRRIAGDRLERTVGGGDRQQVRLDRRDRQPPPGVLAGVPGRRAERGGGRPALRRRHRPGLAAERPAAPRWARAVLLADPEVGGRYSALHRVRPGAGGAGRGRRRRAARPGRGARAVAVRRHGQPRRSRSAPRSAPRPPPAATRWRWSPTAPASTARRLGRAADRRVDRQGRHGHPAGRGREPAAARRHRPGRADRDVGGALHAGRRARRRGPPRRGRQRPARRPVPGLGVRHRDRRPGARHRPVQPAERRPSPRRTPTASSGRRAADRGADVRRGRRSRCYAAGERRRRRSPACCTALLVRPRPARLPGGAWPTSTGSATPARPRSGRCWPPRRPPVTFGWGPRFLHSTGQYHKGGPQVGSFLQITGAVTEDLPVPGKSVHLRRAAGGPGRRRPAGAPGRRRPLLRLHLTDRAAGIRQLLAAANSLQADPAVDLRDRGRLAG